MRYGGITTEEGEAESIGVGIILDKEKESFESRMDFLVFDKRNKSSFEDIYAYAIFLRDDIYGVKERGIVIGVKNSIKVYPGIQKSLAARAESWLLDLVIDGYFEV